MSFVDIRKFIVILNELGYPGTLPMDSFRDPNFEQVADCLHWLLLRYDPTIDLDIDISTDGSRIAFLKQATQIMLSSARIKLNPRRLYSADGYAVKELLKVASFLQSATNATTRHEYETIELGSSIKAFDVKATRLLVSEIKKYGASLSEMLDSELNLQESRKQATMMNTDMDEIEQGLREAISTMLERISSAQQDQELVKKDEDVLQIKLEKRRFELERNENRLSTFHNVRPAYMDKYDTLQKELNELFVVYSKKSRNLQWLQSQMEGHNQEEQVMLDEANGRMRHLQRCLYEEELSILRGEEVGPPKTNLGSSEESDGEGTMLWKWFDGNSFKTILDPNAKADQVPLHCDILGESSTRLTEDTMQWMSHSKDGLKALANPLQNQEFKSNSCTQMITNDAFEVDECVKRRAFEFESSLDGSEISEDLQGDDDEPLDTYGSDLNNTGEDNSSDYDF